MASSYNGKSVNLLRGLDYSVEVVERYSPHSRRTRDLYNFLDVLAVGHGQTVGIQVTSRGNMASRRRKMMEENPETFDRLLKAGWRLEVHGWDQPDGPRTRWRLLIQTFNPDTSSWEPFSYEATA